jgi:hypothetical protein
MSRRDPRRTEHAKRYRCRRLGFFRRSTAVTRRQALGSRQRQTGAPATAPRPRAPLAPDATK